MINIETLPYALQGNETMRTLALLTANALSADFAALNIYGAVDAMPEQLLDALAYDFKIDWWDADADLENKRRVFKNAWNVHRKLGTVGAVEQAVTDAFAGATVREWFDYGGEPYHYMLVAGLGEQTGTEETLQRILTRARWYTNVRSVLDAVEFATVRTRHLYYGCAIMEGVTSVFTVALPV